MELEFGSIAIALVGGLAIFLFGMELLADGLKVIAGSRMRSLLSRMTTNRFKAVFAGAFITAVIQSSSVTTVLVVGFISAGLLSLAQSAGIIMGASIGTTVTAQIVAFQVTQYAQILVAAGFGLSFIGRTAHSKYLGRMVLGLGLLFFGMALMKDATSPLRDYGPFVQMLARIHNPVIAVLASALFTGIIQSSSATAGVIIVLGSQGFLSLEAGIALVLGANIGTCVTALLASIGRPREAVRAALVHILFNVAGVLVWIGLIPYLADFIRWISPAAEGLEGLARLQADTPRQIANAHTVCNVSSTLLFIGFAPLFIRLAEKLVPDRALGDQRVTSRRYLDDILIHTPSLALDVVRTQLGRLGKRVLGMVESAIQPAISGDEAALNELRAQDDEVDLLHGEVVTYMGQLSRQSLSASQSRRLSTYIHAANYFENIGDMIETNLVAAGRQRLAGKVEISPQTTAVLKALHERVCESVRRAVEALVFDQREIAEEILAAKPEVTRLTDDAEAHLTQRLAADAPNRLAAYRVESELVESFRRIFYFSKRIAKLVAEERPD